VIAIAPKSSRIAQDSIPHASIARHIRLIPVKTFRFIMPAYLSVWISLTKICRVPSGAMAGNRNASLVRFQHGEASTRNSPDV
jgi:hypothetical protein